MKGLKVILAAVEKEVLSARDESAEVIILIRQDGNEFKLHSTGQTMSKKKMHEGVAQLVGARVLILDYGKTHAETVPTVETAPDRIDRPSVEPKLKEW